VIEIAASGSGFSYEISCPLVLFDDLEIRGDGDVEVELSGELSDYLEGRGLSKSGSSTVRLSGILSYSGSTNVRGGTLLFDTPEVASSHLEVTAGTVGGVTTLAGGLSVTGTLAPGFPTGTFAVVGDVSLGGILAIDLDGVTHDRLVVGQRLDLSGATLAVATLPGGASEVAYVIASYGSRSGVFETVTGLPAGYRLIYDYDDGNTSNNIAIVQATPTPYDLWVAASNLTGPEAALEADPNGDRVSNGIAFVLGAASALEDSSALLPTAELKGARYEFVFRRVDQASALRAVVQYGTGLESWASAEDGVKGVAIMVTDDHFGPGIDRVVVAMPTALAMEGTLFARLVVTIE
jgi:autotransporter-associated beta strand protein